MVPASVCLTVASKIALHNAVDPSCGQLLAGIFWSAIEQELRSDGNYGVLSWLLFS